jgi:tRNA(Ile)-lysidine synthase
MTAWRSIREKIEGMNSTFILAISGGVDSMVLLDFFRRSKAKFVVAHFNHNLQFINDDMEHHVVNYCLKYNIDYTVGYGVDIEKNYKYNHTSLECEARRQRYEFLFDLSNKTEYSEGAPGIIVTAHHQDDQVETVLLNLFRGVGLQSLYIKEISGGVRSNGHIFRPFLDIPKSELIESATKRGITWVEDPTNAENDAERNWLRNELLPQIMARRNITKTIPLAISKFEDFIYGVDQLTK